LNPTAAAEVALAPYRCVVKVQMPDAPACED
jgi:hypothetical protein